MVLNDSSYQWSIPVDISLGGAKLEITNANATARPAARVAARQVAPEREIFEKVKRGVFRIESGLGHGSESSRPYCGSVACSCGSGCGYSAEPIGALYARWYGVQDR